MKRIKRDEKRTRRVRKSGRKISHAKRAPDPFLLDRSPVDYLSARFWAKLCFDADTLFKDLKPGEHFRFPDATETYVRGSGNSYKTLGGKRRHTSKALTAVHRMPLKGENL